VPSTGDNIQQLNGGSPGTSVPQSVINFLQTYTSKNKTFQVYAVNPDKEPVFQTADKGGPPIVPNIGGSR